MTTTRNSRNSKEPTLKDVMAKLNEMSEDFASLKNRYDQVEAQLAKANERIATLEIEVPHLKTIKEVNEKKNNIIVAGIPKIDQANVNSIVTNITSNLGFEESPKFHAKIIANIKKPENGLISIRFHNLDDKVEVLDRYFKTMKLCVSDVMEGNLSKNRIYLNHDLQKSTREIQKQASLLRKNKKIFSFRVINGKIGIKFNQKDANYEIINDQQTLMDRFN